MRYKNIFGGRDILHRFVVVLPSTRSHYDVKRGGELIQVSCLMIQCNIFASRVNDSRKEEAHESDAHSCIDFR